MVDFVDNVRSNTIGEIFNIDDDHVEQFRNLSEFEHSVDHDILDFLVNLLLTLHLSYDFLHII